MVWVLGVFFVGFFFLLWLNDRQRVEVCLQNQSYSSMFEVAPNEPALVLEAVKS